MRRSLNDTPFRATDPVAAAAEEHLRQMQADGHGELSVRWDGQSIRAAFGALQVQAENYDIALVRLAGEMLGDPRLGMVFLKRMRSTVSLSGRKHLPGRAGEVD